MQIHYRNKSENGGIYKIINIQNGRVYIGSTSCFRKRLNNHRCNLETDRHLNKFMQNDFNKCGTDTFLFEVLEVVIGDKQDRLLREQFYIDQFYDDQKNCYNLVREARDNRGGTRNNKQIDPLTDGRCKPFSEERSSKHSEKLKEIWQQPEYRELSRQNAHKQWQEQSQNNITVTNKETGEKVIINGSVRQFCLERGLSYKAFHQLIKGKLKSSGGWFIGEEEPEYLSQKGQVRKPLSEEHRAKISGGKYTGQLLVNDKGQEIVLSSNVKQQCRDLGLPYSTLIKVLKGKCHSVYGYIVKVNKPT